jgi:uncharacterized protein YajQ (UPF0234 family)
MPSFDIVSEIDMQEVDNAINGVMREIGTRFDFKGSISKVEREKDDLVIHTEGEMQRTQIQDLITTYFTRRKLEAKCLDYQAIEKATGNSIRQKVVVRKGIDTPTAKQIVKAIKDSKMKVQASIQGEVVRVTGTKRDDLQKAIALVKEQGIDLPLQFQNFRD